MGRKRKIPLKKNIEKVQEDTTNIEAGSSIASSSFPSQTHHGPMYTIMSIVQMGETQHKKYVKEMQHLYQKMDHDAFMFTFIKMIKNVMQAEEVNEYAITTLIFCSKYIASYDGGDATHPVLSDTFNWMLKATSNNPHIRFRICQFVNYCLKALGQEAALDDIICDNIMRYMINCLRDISSNVRVQAIYALQRLQNPDNPDDVIVKSYKFHLNSDPSPRVRQAVITAIGRNYNTIPYILERLWDTDEKTRRHTYVNMSSYPVKAYKVSERITFLEQGLNDRSEMVRKVVTNVMLPQWLQAYNKNYIGFIAGLKIDANEIEMERFRKIAKITLQEIFKHEQIEDLIKCLPLQLEVEKEFTKCITESELNVETSFYWLNLIEYLIQINSDDIDEIIPELTTFCNFVTKYCESQKFDEEDKWRKMEFQYILLTLIEILLTFDLGDEIGRDNLKQLIKKLLINHELEYKCVEMIIRCSENLVTNQEDRLHFFIDIIKEITDANMFKNSDIFNNRELLEESLEKNPDKSLKLKLSALKVKILDLEEQETNFVDKKDYVQAQKIADEKEICKEEYRLLVQSIMEQSGLFNNQSDQENLIIFHRPKKITTEEIIKCLQISYYMVNSSKVKSLTPSVCDLYKEFIRRHIESNQIAIRDWALKCGTVYSMLYEQLAKDVYSELYSQFFKNQNVAIWKTAISCLFELIDRYGFTTFESEEKQNKNKRPGRMLYNTMEFLDVEEDESANLVDFVFMVSHILDTCNQEAITEACIIGLCRLVLHGHIVNDTIIQKLLIKYFNPLTEPAINQILGVFFENLVQRKKQEFLQTCLLPTVSTILVAPYDSPLHEIKPDSILKFVIDSTRPQFCIVGSNIHNQIALSFLNEIQNNIANKESAKLLSKELISLQINIDDSSLISDLKNACTKLLQCDLDSKVSKNVVSFKAILDGTYRASILHPQSVEHNSDEEPFELSDDEDNQTRDKTNATQSIDNGNKGSINSEKAETVSETLTTISEESQEKETEMDKTPTMFGRDNSPNIRYLRKSLNSRRNSISTPIKKIRIEAKMQSDKKGIEEVSDHENEGQESENIDVLTEKNSSLVATNELEIQTEQNNMNGINNNTISKNTNPNNIQVDNNEISPSPKMKTPTGRKTKSLANGKKTSSEPIMQTRSLRKNRYLSSKSEITVEKVTQSNSENKAKQKTKDLDDNIVHKSLLNVENTKKSAENLSQRHLRQKNINSRDNNVIMNFTNKSVVKNKEPVLVDNGAITKKKFVTRSSKNVSPSPEPSTPSSEIEDSTPSTDISQNSVQIQNNTSRNGEWSVSEINDVDIIPVSPVITRSNRKRHQRITTEGASFEKILTRNKRPLNTTMSPTSDNESTTIQNLTKKKKTSKYCEIENKDEKSPSLRTPKQNTQSEKLNKNQSQKSKNSSESGQIETRLSNGSYKTRSNESYKTRSVSKEKFLFNNIITRRRHFVENTETPKNNSTLKNNSSTEKRNSSSCRTLLNVIESSEKSTNCNRSSSKEKMVISTRNGLKKASKIPIKKTTKSEKLSNQTKFTIKIVKNVKEKNADQSKVSFSKILPARETKQSQKSVKDNVPQHRQNIKTRLPIITLKRIKK